MTDTTDDFEIKATAGGQAGDVADRFGEFMTAFDEFKRTNDQRLLQIE